MHSRRPVSRTFSRRDILKVGAASTTGISSLAGVVRHGSGGAAARQHATPILQAPFTELEEVTIAQLRAMLDGRQMSVRELVDAYLARIDAIDIQGPGLNSVIEVNPDARAIADALDAAQISGASRGPLHGIPVMLKDNIDTADQMLTTAGSLALTHSRPTLDAFVAQRLRDAGAVILGKTTLSEWANFRGFQATSGWSGRGGQCNNPYFLDRNPCGSSSGSAAAVSANLCAGAVGTETDGSIVCPSSNCGVVGIKPTVGLTSRAGVIPIAHSQDTVGPQGRTVADAAMMLEAMVGADPRDPMTLATPIAGTPVAVSTGMYTQALDLNGLQGARIGVPRNGGFWGYSRQADAICEAAIELMRDLGATVMDPADFPSGDELYEEPGEFEVLLYEFKADLNSYLAERNDPELRTLEDLIRFNEDNAAQELQYFGQEIFLMAQEKGPLTDRAYLDALARNHRVSRDEAIDAVLRKHDLDAIIAPTGGPAWKTDLINGDLFLGSSSAPAAMAGYPIVTVPAGYAYGLPVGLSFIGTAFSEVTLIRLAYAFEQATQVRRAPQFLPGSVEPPSGLVAIETITADIEANVTAVATPATPEATPSMAPTP